MRFYKRADSKRAGPLTGFVTVMIWTLIDGQGRYYNHMIIHLGSFILRSRYIYVNWEMS